MNESSSPRRSVSSPSDSEQTREGRRRWKLTGQIHGLNADETIEVMPVAEARVAIELLSTALGVALVAVQDFVNGNGPRGLALLPIMSLADEAANARDALLGGFDA